MGQDRRPERQGRRECVCERAELQVLQPQIFLNPPLLTCSWESINNFSTMAAAAGEHRVCLTPVDGVNVTVHFNGSKGFELEWRDVRCLPSSSDADVSRNATPRAHTEAILDVQGLLKVILKIVFGEDKDGVACLPTFESKGVRAPSTRLVFALCKEVHPQNGVQIGPRSLLHPRTFCARLPAAPSAHIHTGLRDCGAPADEKIPAFWSANMPFPLCCCCPPLPPRLVEGVVSLQSGTATPWRPCAPLALAAATSLFNMFFSGLCTGRQRECIDVA